MFSLIRRRQQRTTLPARLTATAAFGSALSVAALMATDIIPVPSWALDGVDVASHQHPGGAAIDWNAVAADGQSFAFIKATEGTGYTNPFFSSDSVKAQQAGIMPGSYHYARPGTNDPRAEAAFYAATLATGPQPSLPPVLDLEENGGLSPAQLQSWTRTWIEEIKRLTGRDPIIYTYYNFWHESMANTTEFSEYPLWLAYYSDSLPNTIPGGWKYVTFWQYSDNGNVDGIRTNVDMNRYYGSDEQLQNLARSMPEGTLAGDISEALDPIRGLVGKEADAANAIETATGVDVPLTTDFLMLVLGVAAGRLGPEVLLTQGASTLGDAGLGSSNADAPATKDPNSDGPGARGSVAATQDLLRAIMALSGALKDTNANGKQIPLDALGSLLQSGAVGDKAANGTSTVKIGQLLGLLQSFGGTQNWSAKLANGEVPADPNALQDLADAATAVTPAPEGTPLPDAALLGAAGAVAPGAPVGPSAQLEAPAQPLSPVN